MLIAPTALGQQKMSHMLPMSLTRVTRRGRHRASVAELQAPNDVSTHDIFHITHHDGWLAAGYALDVDVWIEKQMVAGTGSCARQQALARTSISPQNPSGAGELQSWRGHNSSDSGITVLAPAPSDLFIADFAMGHWTAEFNSFLTAPKLVLLCCWHRQTASYYN